MLVLCEFVNTRGSYHKVINVQNSDEILGAAKKHVDFSVSDFKKKAEPFVQNEKDRLHMEEGVKIRESTKLYRYLPQNGKSVF